MSTKSIIGSLVFVVILAGVAYALYAVAVENQTAAISNFEECVAAGNPVMESYPRQCRTDDGRLFVEEIPNQSDNDPSGTMPAPNVGEGCAVGGCSLQICGEEGEVEDIVTTCEYRAEYACYQETRCQRQTNGQCEWTQTAELQACMENAESLEGSGNVF